MNLLERSGGVATDASTFAVVPEHVARTTTAVIAIVLPTVAAHLDLAHSLVRVPAVRLVERIVVGTKVAAVFTRVAQSFMFRICDGVRVLGSERDGRV